MENLPVEILQHISLFMDDRTRRFMRLASTKWFKIINYNNFTCYFVKSLQSLKELSVRLSKYQNQNIGLTLLKGSPIDETQLIDNISILTNLVSLSLDSQYYDNRGCIYASTKLTSLTKLNYFDIKAEYPIELAKRLTQLTSPKFHRFSTSFADVAEVLALNSNIQSLEITPDSSRDQVDIFASIANPSILTKLKVDFFWIEPKNELSMSKLINLKWLEYCENHNTERCFPIGSLTSLEYLSLTVDRHLSEQFDQNTNLTGLEITSKYATAQYLENISKLTKLQKLSLKTPQCSSAHTFLTALTALSDFTLFYFDLDIHETLTFINTAQLTRLSLTLAQTPYTCDPICRLTSLQELILRTDAININYNALSTLTNLTTLYLLLKTNNIGRLTIHLTKLKHLVIDSKANRLLTGVDFRSLPNLEMLEGPLLDTNTFNSLVSSTNLTSLKIHLSDEIKTYNYSILTRLPLREFINNAKTNNDDTLWRALGQITTLEAISQQSLDSDEKMLYLTKLSRLTSLKIFHSENMTGKHLTALTSIQVLTFKSARSIFSSHNDPYKMRIELDNLEMHLPYLYSKQL